MPIIVPLIDNPETSAPRTSTAKWKVITPPAAMPINSSLVVSHLRLDSDESGLIDAYIAAAVDYAESRMECCLMPQDIQAVFYDGQPLILPRGPLLQVYQVQDCNENYITDYGLTNTGHLTRIVPNVAVQYPMSVSFQAGYATANDVPGSIKLALLAHVGTLYEARESTTDKARTVVPHSLDDFYRLKSRGVMIG